MQKTLNQCKDHSHTGTHTTQSRTDARATHALTINIGPSLYPTPSPLTQPKNSRPSSNIHPNKPTTVFFLK